MEKNPPVFSGVSIQGSRIALKQIRKGLQLIESDKRCTWWKVGQIYLAVIA